MAPTRNAEAAPVGNKRKMNAQDTDKTSKQGRMPLSFIDLTGEIQEMVIAFCDVPELGALGRCCKKLHGKTREDKFWEKPLRHLLKFGFDDAFKELMRCEEAVYYMFEDNSLRGKIANLEDLSRMPFKSTSFAKWYYAHLSVFSNCIEDVHGGMRDTCIPAFESDTVHELYRHNTFRELVDDPIFTSEDLCWFIKDVPLWKYYRNAGACYFEGHLNVTGGRVAEDLPNIFLFRLPYDLLTGSFIMGMWYSQISGRWRRPT